MAWLETAELLRQPSESEKVHVFEFKVVLKLIYEWCH